MTSRPSTAPILAVLAVLLVTLGAYVGLYFYLGVRLFAPPGTDPPQVLRFYSSAWMSDFFRPAAFVEAQIRGKRVVLGSNLMEMIFESGDFSVEPLLDQSP
jgi:hypothetical protein